MSAIRFTTTLSEIGPHTILRLPPEASAHLPSRGMAMVVGSVNGHPFQYPLEPDGNGSHWLEVDEVMQKAIKANIGDTVMMEIDPSKDWPEPKVPADVQAALRSNTQANKVWQDITPMARWDWIRWISSTKQAETRKRRIEVACSKLVADKRRPCCFNRTECTVPDISKNGVLITT